MNFFRPVSTFFSRLTNAIIGDLSWHPPGWAEAVKGGVVRHPIISTTSVIGLIALLVGGWWSWNWYEHRPKPPTVSWIINLADAPAPSDDFQAQNLTVTFDKSVAKLDTIGKEVKSGISLSPKIEGRWTWSGGTQLVFEPTENWPAATTFHIKLTRGLFSPHARIETMSKEFHTTPFTLAISDSKFYVSPKDSLIKQLTATLTFSHPVDRKSLEKNLSLTLETGDQVFKNAPNETGRCTVTYDKADRIAYIRSVNIDLPKESAHAVLTVPDDVVSAQGQAHLDVGQVSQVLIPNLYDMFHIGNASAVIATNRAGEPEQTLVLSTSVGVKTEVLGAAIHAWVLPRKKPGVDDETYA